MARRRKSADLDADFSDDRLRHDCTHARNGRETVDNGAKRTEEQLEAGIHSPQPFLDGFDLRQVQTQEKPVVLPHLPLKRRLQLIGIRAQ